MITIKQHQYAVKRLGAAVERSLRAKTKQEKLQAAKWMVVWGAATGVVPFPASGTDSGYPKT